MPQVRASGASRTGGISLSPPVCPDVFMNLSFVDEARDVGAFGKWVQSLDDWQAFGTFTFEREVSTQTAARCFEDCIVRYLPGVRSFYSVERHKAHGGHLHALFAGVSSLHVKGGVRRRLLVTDLDGVDLWDVWKRRYGRNSIEVPMDRSHTARYCAKYITKAAALWNYNGAGAFRKRETEIEQLAQWIFPGCSEIVS